MTGDHLDSTEVTVVIPCRNEAEALPTVLASIPAGYRTVVVDNGSTDATADVARGRGATVVAEDRPGYGAAVQAGIGAARTELVAVLDGDGSMDPAELPALVELVRGGADLAVGRRRPNRPGVWPWHARLGNRLVARRLRRHYGLPVHDIGAMRVASRGRLQALGPLHDRFGYPLELLVAAARAGWVVTERDITYRPRAGGTSKVSGSWRGSLRATRDFLAVLR
ncbi:glycosyltransferase family 2 protein [Nocardia donostiensis]|uniref:Glycosyltransferase n=1 Tax=Nocardia donostiensis TaxID=1538463 RepID=A0A1V2TKK0_9NOCA|nr:glycosyltransferase family 2 protein [Nocardia donostiensis]ONM50055.1 glycosyltransferase [Nocardia donostiensis]OQS19421.1 glycosyltransferase [Nocardia donostiensis]